MPPRKTPAAVSRPFFNPYPKYLQVRQALERRMEGEYELGQQIPTEAALCAEFGVSRETVREALRGLEEDGIVERRRPTGTFFVRRPEHPVAEKLTGLVEDLTALRLNTHARLLDAGALKTQAETRMVDGDAREVVRIRRLRFFEDQPLVLHEAFLPAALGAEVAALDLRHASISQLLEAQFGIRCSEESQQIEAMVADTHLAKLLDIAIGAPVLLVRRLLRLHGRNAMVLFKSYYRADRYRYTLNLAPPRAGVKAAKGKRAATASSR